MAHTQLQTQLNNKNVALIQVMYANPYSEDLPPGVYYHIGMTKNVVLASYNQSNLTEQNKILIEQIIASLAVQSLQ